VERFGGQHVRRLGIAAGLAVGVETAGFWLYRWVTFLSGDLRGPDFFSFYAATRLFIERGGSAVYELAVQRAYQAQVTAQWAPLKFVLMPYIHPPYVTPLLAPLGLLPYREAVRDASAVGPEPVPDGELQWSGPQPRRVSSVR